MTPADKRAVLTHLHTEIATLKAPALVGEWVERPLTDVDVRHPDPEDLEHQGMIEVSTFCEGEYVESLYIDKARAAELRDQLNALVSWAGPPECEHVWEWVRDWYGDPSIPNGTCDCSGWICKKCGSTDCEDEPPGPPEPPDPRDD